MSKTILLKWFLVWLSAITGFFPFIAPAQTAAPKPSEKRFLFIIEMSSELKKSSTIIQQSIIDLVESGMGGIMEDGDTFGLWTFNEQLYTGQFPMQQWASTNTTEITKRLEIFFKLHRFEKSPRLENVFPKMFPVIRTSPVITVVLVTSGSRPLQGTPFDREVNAYFKENYRLFQKQKMPFLTMLLARNGEILRHSVSPALGDVKIPKPPAAPMEIVTAATNAIPAPPSPPPPPSPKNQALIIGKSGAQLIVATNEGVSLEEEVTKKLQADAAEKAAAQAKAEASKLLAEALAEQNRLATPPTSQLEPNEPIAPAPVPAEQQAVVTKTRLETTERATDGIKTETAPKSVPFPASAVTPSEGQPPPEIDATEAAWHSNENQSSASTLPMQTPPTRPLKTSAPEVRSAPLEKSRPLSVNASPAPSGSKLILLLGALSILLALVVAFLLGRQSAKGPATSLITQSVERTDKR